MATPGAEKALPELRELLAALRAESGRLRVGGWPAVVIAGVAALAAASSWVAVRDGPNVVFYTCIAVYRWLFG